MNESEKLFEQEIEERESKHLYEYASHEFFCSNPTDMGAKYLWLKYTLREDNVPPDVLERMKKIIKNEIKRKIKADVKNGRTPYGSLNKREEERPMFMLLDIALNNRDHFWEILLTPTRNSSSVQFNDDLLEKSRESFPSKRELKSNELFHFFGKLIDLEEQGYGESIQERMRLRYRTYIKNRDAEMILFK